MKLTYDDIIDICSSLIVALIGFFITKYAGIEYGIAYTVYFIVKRKPT